MRALFGREAWLKGQECRENGRHLKTDRDTMLAAVSEPATRNYWSQWSSITCPTLVLRETEA
ncbi:hypothetical protein [Streptomyces sp. NPDC058755]|uniref:hypothetical protein n=1 Tax=Streptomyces sp. NPDC058755 TaxID=3346624 RepID=UPI0036A58DE1